METSNIAFINASLLIPVYTQFCEPQILTTNKKSKMRDKPWKSLAGDCPIKLKVENEMCQIECGFLHLKIPSSPLVRHKLFFWNEGSFSFVQSQLSLKFPCHLLLETWKNFFNLYRVPLMAAAITSTAATAADILFHSRHYLKIFCRFNLVYCYVEVELLR